MKHRGMKNTFNRRTICSSSHTTEEICALPCLRPLFWRSAAPRLPVLAQGIDMKIWDNTCWQRKHLPVHLGLLSHSKDHPTCRNACRTKKNCVMVYLESTQMHCGHFDARATTPGGLVQDHSLRGGHHMFGSAWWARKRGVLSHGRVQRSSPPPSPKEIRRP